MLKFAGYRYLLGPEQLFVEPGRRVSSPLEYLTWHMHAVTSRAGNPWDSDRPATARVNHGRWIADCVWCGTGMLTRPEWGVAYCGECGARYRGEKIKYPRAHKELERLLVLRVRRDQQNWDERQSVAELEKENQSPEVLTP